MFGKSVGGRRLSYLTLSYYVCCGLDWVEGRVGIFFSFGFGLVCLLDGFVIG